jgi:hypothetical protein
MESKFHRWWLGACVAALLLASWVGGFSVAVTSVFVVIYLTGVTLIGPDEAPAGPVDVVAAEPVDIAPAELGWRSAGDAVTVEAPAEADVEVKPVADAEPPGGTAAGHEVTLVDEAAETAEAVATEEAAETAEAVATEEAAEAVATEEAAEAVATEQTAEAVATEQTAEAVATEQTAEAVATVEVIETVETDATSADDAVPYPDDFEDEKVATEVEERSPA